MARYRATRDVAVGNKLYRDGQYLPVSAMDPAVVRRFESMGIIEPVHEPDDDPPGIDEEE